MKTTKAIIFDAFGTLIRYTTRTAPYGGLADADGRLVDRLACLTRNVPLATLTTEIGAGDKLDVILPDLADELSGLRLFPEVADVLAKARAVGLRLAVCSNLAYEYGPAVRGLVPELDVPARLRRGGLRSG
jgi:beta-phosphoglucomutase-like phosphatase (HAD superfamily)